MQFEAQLERLLLINEKEHHSLLNEELQQLFADKVRLEYSAKLGNLIDSNQRATLESSNRNLAQVEANLNDSVETIEFIKNQISGFTDTLSRIQHLLLLVNEKVQGEIKSIQLHNLNNQSSETSSDLYDSNDEFVQSIRNQLNLSETRGICSKSEILLEIQDKINEFKTSSDLESLENWLIKSEKQLLEYSEELLDKPLVPNQLLYKQFLQRSKINKIQSAVKQLQSRIRSSS